MGNLNPLENLLISGPLGAGMVGAGAEATQNFFNTDHYRFLQRALSGLNSDQIEQIALQGTAPSHTRYNLGDSKDEFEKNVSGALTFEDLPTTQEWDSARVETTAQYLATKLNDESLDQAEKLSATLQVYQTIPEHAAISEVPVQQLIRERIEALQIETYGKYEERPTGKPDANGNQPTEKVFVGLEDGHDASYDDLLSSSLGEQGATGVLELETQGFNAKREASRLYALLSTHPEFLKGDPLLGQDVAGTWDKICDTIFGEDKETISSSEALRAFAEKSYGIDGDSSFKPSKEQMAEIQQEFLRIVSKPIDLSAGIAAAVPISSEFRDIIEREVDTPQTRPWHNLERQTFFRAPTSAVLEELDVIKSLQEIESARPEERARLQQVRDKAQELDKAAEMADKLGQTFNPEQAIEELRKIALNDSLSEAEIVAQLKARYEAYTKLYGIGPLQELDPSFVGLVEASIETERNIIKRSVAFEALPLDDTTDPAQVMELLTGDLSHAPPQSRLKATKAMMFSYRIHQGEQIEIYKKEKLPLIVALGQVEQLGTTFQNVRDIPALVQKDGLSQSEVRSRYSQLDQAINTSVLSNQEDPAALNTIVESYRLFFETGDSSLRSELLSNSFRNPTLDSDRYLTALDVVDRAAYQDLVGLIAVTSEEMDQLTTLHKAELEALQQTGSSDIEAVQQLLNGRHEKRMAHLYQRLELSGSPELQLESVRANLSPENVGAAISERIALVSALETGLSAREDAQKALTLERAKQRAKNDIYELLQLSQDGAITDSEAFISKALTTEGLNTESPILQEALVLFREEAHAKSQPTTAPAAEEEGISTGQVAAVLHNVFTTEAADMKGGQITALSNFYTAMTEKPETHSKIEAAYNEIYGETFDTTMAAQEAKLISTLELLRSAPSTDADVKEEITLIIEQLQKLKK